MKDRIILSMSAEKLSALEMYLRQKNTTINAEIDKYAEQLYTKIVPQNVREYIDLTSDSRTVRRERTKKNDLDRTPSDSVAR